MRSAALFLPVAILEVIATLPFQVAIWALTLFDRSSTQLAGVVVVTLTSGAVLGVLIGVATSVIRSRLISAG